MAVNTVGHKFSNDTNHHHYPGSEFVVAYTLAKWIKLEPNEIYFSQGFSQKLFCI